MPQERRRKHELKEIWNGLFYLVRTDCQWCMLPKEYSKRELVYYYFRKWSDMQEFDLLLSNLRESVRLMRVLKELCSSVKTIIADGGYRGELTENTRNTFGYVLQVVISSYSKHGFKPIKKRWVIERTFAWFDYNQRLCRNY